MARMRPTDVIWATLPLFVLVVAVRRWRRPRLLLALVAGLVAGAGEWIADALVHLVTAPGRAATVQRTTPSHRGWASTAAELHRLGVRPPCPLTGCQAVPIAFYAGCSSVVTSGHNANTTQSDIVRAGQREPVAVVTTPAGRPPAYARDWAPHRAGDLRVHVVRGAGGGTV